MIRTELPSRPGGRWDGLVLDVARPARPGLRVEAAGGRRLLLRQADRPVLYARQRASHYGVHYARTGRYHSPVPAIGVDEARRVTSVGADEDDRVARWAHRFLDRLAASAEGPLHEGRWVLGRGMPHWAVTASWHRLTTVDPDRGHVTWFGYGDPEEDVRDVLPLRRLSPPDAPRVRAHRRRLREGVPAPVLLWWVSGLNTMLVLDGHDRIVAALAEGVLPEVLVLAPAGEPRYVAAVEERAVREYTGRMNGLRVDGWRADARVSVVNRRFAEELAQIVRMEGRTRAWPLPGGRAAWDRLVGADLPGWAPDPD